MSANKQTRRELLEIEVRINELDRAQPYLKSDFYWERRTSLLERKESITEKLERKELAPDIQFILSETSDAGEKSVELCNGNELHEKEFNKEVTDVDFEEVK